MVLLSSRGAVFDPALRMGRSEKDGKLEDDKRKVPSGVDKLEREAAHKARHAVLTQNQEVRV